jgi:hypothetical protein
LEKDKITKIIFAMKKLIFFVLIFILSSTAFAQKKKLPEVTIDKLPSNTEEFLNLRDKLATTPQGGAAIFVVASILYTQNPELGRQCLIIASDKSLLNSSAKGGYQGFDFGNSSNYLIQQLDSKKHVPNSYIQGTSPNTQYALGNPPYKVICSTNPYSGNEQDGTLKVFIQCSGADSDRPITLLRNEKGIWKAKEFSSLVVGIRPPKQKSKGAADGDF